MTAVYSTNSPYTATPQLNTYVQYLDYWIPPSLSSSSADKTIILDTKYKNRPDLLSYDYYGTPKLWWIFAAYNTDIIKDPIYDLIPGIQIVVPAKSSLVGVL